MNIHLRKFSHSLFKFKEIEVRPACVLGVEVLFAAILEAETFIEFVGGGVRSEGIETDGLHAICLSKMNSFAYHL